jgi:probable rRNA maturation factor
MSVVNFFSADKKLHFVPKRELKAFLNELFTNENKKISRLDYIFCSDSFLLDINRRFLNHDYYTDIITFDLSETKNETIAEIYISLDRVKENARKLETKYRNEILRVVFHGALHLCDYKDKTQKQIKEIRQKEDFYIKRFERKYPLL